jgi:carboxyl-terminal processing protease
MKPEESKKFEEQINGSFGGVGIEIGMRKGALTVIAPIKNSPAEKVGIQAGDIIVKIDDQDTAGINIDEAVTKIRGKKGTAVKLAIQRPDLKEPKEFSIVRDEIKIPTADWKLINDKNGRKSIAHLQLFVFNRNVDQEFRKVVKEIIDSGAESIVLDLRNNPGGLLDSSVNIAGTFLGPDQVVVSERFADKTETVLKTTNGSELKKYPLVILINKGSASASEILAGALRDNRQIKIVGEASFGKGSVQELLDFPSSTNKSTLKVTIAKWYTPGGVSISDEGIKPDFEIKRSEEDITSNLDPQLKKAIELLSQ